MGTKRPARGDFVRDPKISGLPPFHWGHQRFQVSDNEGILRWSSTDCHQRSVALATKRQDVVLAGNAVQYVDHWKGDSIKFLTMISTISVGPNEEFLRCQKPEIVGAPNETVAIH